MILSDIHFICSDIFLVSSWSDWFVFSKVDTFCLSSLTSRFEICETGSFNFSMFLIFSIL
jgi:hypothetical protein